MAHYNLIFGIISCVLGLIFWIRLPRGTLKGYFKGFAKASVPGADGIAERIDKGSSDRAILFWAIFAVATNIGITTLFGKFFPSFNPPESRELENIANDFIGKLIVFPLVLIIVPFFEEVLFRGLIVDGFLAQKIRAPIAILFSGLLFAFCHGPAQILGAFAFACGLSQIRTLRVQHLGTGSLRVNFWVHAANNAFGLAMLFAHLPEVTYLGGAILLVLGLASGVFAAGSLRAHF
jgi:membrane protease YdiL (CAAX protease family)